MCYRSYFLKILLDIIKNTFRRIQENWADDFAVDNKGDLSEINSYKYVTLLKKLRK